MKNYSARIPRDRFTSELVPQGSGLHDLTVIGIKLIREDVLDIALYERFVSPPRNLRLKSEGTMAIYGFGMFLPAILSTCLLQPLPIQSEGYFKGKDLDRINDLVTTRFGPNAWRLLLPAIWGDGFVVAGAQKLTHAEWVQTKGHFDPE